MPLPITRRFEFDAAHRVLGHESKCRHLHGHRYVAEVSVRAADSKLDELGRVIDFSVLKEKVGHWIDTYWDHNILLHPDDPLLGICQPPGLARVDGLQGNIYLTEQKVFGGKAPFVFPPIQNKVYGGNPTAENMAVLLYNQASDILAPYNLRVTHVRIYETPNCRADYYET